MFLKGTLNWWVLFVIVILGAAAVIAGFKGDLSRSEADVTLMADEAPTSLIFEVEPNDSIAQAGAAMPIITFSTDIMGAIVSSLDVDYFKFSVSAQTVVNFEIFDGGGTDCSSGTMPAATTLTLYNNGGTQLVTDTASAGIGTCASINYPLAPGTYYVKVAKLTSGSVPQYILKIHYLFDTGSETEPNDTLASANPLTATPEQFVFGNHQISSDTDFYQITLASTNSLRLETVEGDNTETCESNGIFSTITLFNSGGTVLGSDSASGRGFCSQIDGRGSAPVNAFAHNLSPGVYFVSVKAATGCSGTLCLFNYRLVIQTDVPLMPPATPTDTPTATQTTTPTPTPTLGPTPILGDYSNASIPLSSDMVVMPIAAPLNTTSISVFTSTNFKGRLEGDPVTGKVRITNAHPAGNFPITVTAFGPGGTATATFTLTVMTPPSCTPAGFAPPVNYVTDNEPIAVAVGDLNGDGKQDVISANFLSSTISVALGDGAGGITSVTNFPSGIQFGASPSSLVVGDFNGDGKQDVAVANGNNDSVNILLGNGSGGLSAPIGVAAGFGLTSIAEGDLNGDDKQDLVVTHSNLATVSVLLRDGAGGFTLLSDFAVGTQPKSVAIGDFNSDGKLDLVTANFDSNNVSVLLGDGSGNFGAATNYPMGVGANSPTAVAIGDLNNDGKQDLAVANGSGVSVLLGNGLGIFGAAINFTGGSMPNSIEFGDFNNDGNQDLVLGKQGSFANVTVLLGNGTGSLSGTQFFTTASVPWAAAVGDLNGDGKQDIVSANHDTFNISILLSTCGVSTPTSTATNTPTSTPTSSGTPSISGTVTYGNASAPPKYISNVAVTGTGSPNVFTTTAAPGGTAGQYTLTGFGAGSYTVSLSKTTGQNSITSNDAARIAAHVTGANLLTTDNQKVSADVTGNGAISSQDAAKIAQVVAGLPFSPPNFTGTWKFFLPPGPTFPIGASPASRTYPSITSNITGDDYVGLLIGEVTGNWTPSAARPLGGRQLAEGSGPVQGIGVRLPDVSVDVGKEIVVPVMVEGIADKGVISYEFDLRYDPLVMQPLADVVDLKDTASRGLSVVTNATVPGILRVVVYGAYPIDKDGVLLNLRFTAVGAVGSVSPISFERMMFNEGESRVTVFDGRVELF